MRIAVVGTPVAQGSKRHVGHGIMIESGGERLRDWRNDIKLAACERGVHIPEDAVRVELDFFFTRPRGHFGKRGLRPSAPGRPAVRPDIDKLARACLDALTGIVWRDDAQVTELVCRKHYAADGNPPGVTIEVEAL